MPIWSEFLSACATALQGEAAASWLSYGTPVGLLLLGLVGGVTHCAGMCGPFVLSQTGTRLAAVPLQQSTMFRRLSGVLLLPYHFGRITTYSLLGGIAAGATGGVQQFMAGGYLPAVALAIAAGWFLTAGLLQYMPRLAASGARMLGGDARGPLPRLFARPQGFNGYLLGVLLGFLPCSLIYTGLLLAGASGDWRIGAASMAAFAVGTMPALLVIGGLGAAAGAKWRARIRLLLAPVLVLNAGLLLVLAWRLFQG